MSHEFIPASPGWRIVLVDRENDGSAALPIVAWRALDDDHRYLDAYYVPNETGVPPQRLSSGDLVCGYLAPGQEHESFWDDVARELRKVEDDIEERAARQRGPS